MNTLRDLFLMGVKKAPKHLFLSDGYQHLTYEMTCEQAHLRACVLFSKGVCQGDRVIIIDSEPLETTLWLLACSLCGSVFVILHNGTSKMRMEALLQDIDPVGVIDFRDDYSGFYQERLSGRFLIHTKGIDDIPSDQNTTALATILETDPAFLVYTSGSTDLPKAVICPHRAVLFVTSSINSYLSYSSQDRIGHSLSLAYVYGLYQLFLAMQAQASVIFLGKASSQIDLFTRLEKFQISVFPTVRSTLALLARLKLSKELKHVRSVTCAGDYLPRTLVEIFLDQYKQIEFFSMYGLSECSRALYMPPHRLASKPEAVGRPISGTRAFIVDEQGRMLPPGETGELIIEGPHIMSGYWRAPAETSARFIHGSYNQPQLRTGDLFWQDGDGDFYFVGRKNNIIKSRGFRISPREVETAILAANPFLQECAVYAVEHEVLGQAIHALVTAADSTHPVEEIFTRCRATMEPYLIPEKISIVPTIPTIPNGKYILSRYKSR